MVIIVTIYIFFAILVVAMVIKNQNKGNHRCRLPVMCRTDVAVPAATGPDDIQIHQSIPRDILRIFFPKVEWGKIRSDLSLIG